MMNADDRAQAYKRLAAKLAREWSSVPVNERPVNIPVDVSILQAILDLDRRLTEHAGSTGAQACVHDQVLCNANLHTRLSVLEEESDGSRHQEELDGSPAHVQVPFIDIKFQLGPIQEVGVNGCQIEDVFNVLIIRLEGFQRGLFSCPENAVVLQHLYAVKTALCARHEAREQRGVEGYNKP